MAAEESSPLLGATSPAERPTSRQSENTPLLNTDNTRYDGEERLPSPAATSLRSLQEGRKKKRSIWPTVIAVTTLSTIVLAIVVAAFFAPAVVEEYAKESLVIEPTNLSIEKFTGDGVQARIQANFRLDASRVQRDAVRNIGRAGTWLAHKIESQQSVVKVYLPEYDNFLLGTAFVPPVVVNIRDGENTHVDFVTELKAGDAEGLKRVANDWLEGRLGQIRVQGKADVSLKSGIFPLGTQSVSESLVFEGSDIPAMPQYNITRLNFHEVDLAKAKGMAADVTLSVVNPYPVRLTIPPLGFDILVPNCATTEPYIVLADAHTKEISVEPEDDVRVDVAGIVQELPEPLTKACPNSNLSPLDHLLGTYIHGEDATIFVRGSGTPTEDTPEWITKIISSFTVPVPFPGRSFDNLVRNFSLTDVHFGLPSLFEPDSSPDVSGKIEVLATLPKEMNFGVDVSKVRATADVFYKAKKLGVLDLKKWQKAKSTRIEATKDAEAAIKIESEIKNAPLNITDQDVFQDVLMSLLGGDDILLRIKALVDVEVETVLGTFVVRDVPGEGDVPVNAFAKGGFAKLSPHVYDLEIIDTTQTSLTLQAKVNFTNPTPYTADVPYANIHILNNGSLIGEATARDLHILKGNNTGVLVQAVWNPSMGGKNGSKIGRDLLSQYISGWNTTLTFKTHRGTIPNQPELGEALSGFEIEMPTPRLSAPDDDGNGDDDGDVERDPRKPHFIKDATFHLFSSTATFTLLSPLQQSTIYIERINATAFYNHTEPIGRIVHNLPFKVPPGQSETPRLPVDWSLDSVGYEKVRKALGGDLKLDAEATVGIRLNQWREEIWYIGGGIGAKVRL